MPLTLSGNGTVSGVNTDIGMRIVTPTSVSGGSLNTGGSVTFSVSSGISLNGCFTALYESYFLTLNLTATSGNDISLLFRLRNSGVDELNSSYSYNRILQTSTTISGSTTAGATQWQVGGTTNTYSTLGFNQMYIHSPKISAPTKFQASCYWLSSAAARYQDQYVGDYNSTNQYDGLTIYPSSGTLSGTIRIYGYNNG